MIADIIRKYGWLDRLVFSIPDSNAEDSNAENSNDDDSNDENIVNKFLRSDVHVFPSGMQSIEEINDYLFIKDNQELGFVLHDLISCRSEIEYIIYILSNYECDYETLVSCINHICIRNLGSQTNYNLVELLLQKLELYKNFDINHVHDDKVVFRNTFLGMFLHGNKIKSNESFEIVNLLLEHGASTVYTINDKKIDLKRYAKKKGLDEIHQLFQDFEEFSDIKGAVE